MLKLNDFSEVRDFKKSGFLMLIEVLRLFVMGTGSGLHLVVTASRQQVELSAIVAGDRRRHCRLTGDFIQCIPGLLRLSGRPHFIAASVTRHTALEVKSCNLMSNKERIVTLWKDNRPRGKAGALVLPSGIMHSGGLTISKGTEGSSGSGCCERGEAQRSGQTTSGWPLSRDPNGCADWDQHLPGVLRGPGKVG